MRIFLGLGANLGDRADSLSRALALLASNPITVRRISPVIESAALLPKNAPAEWNLPFLNLVVECETEESPETCFEWIEAIQEKLGREDGARWAPRTIDIDILLWGTEIIRTDRLTIPHPRLHERNFVLTPLISLEPTMTIPGRAEKTLLDWSRELEQHIPLWMGVVNVTPDSFSDGGTYQTWGEIEPHVDAMIDAGAHIIDIGGESTRPGAKPVSAETEWRRIESVLYELVARRRESALTPKISVDSYHARTIERALALGVDIINDVSGLTSPEMLELAGSSDADWIAMHSVSVPVDSEHHLPATANGYQSVEDSLLQRLETWDTAGLNLNRIIFDPGIGFGKSSAQSMQIMERAGELRRHGLRVLVGHSRKSFLNQTIGEDIGDKDRATVDLSLKLSEQGVDILRVHNVPMHTAAYRESAQIQAAEFSDSC